MIRLSMIDEIYGKAYDRLCGVHPRIRCWHFQWLAVKDLYKDLRRVLFGVRGRILDVGCGTKPYVTWMCNVDPSNVVGGDRLVNPACPDAGRVVHHSRFSWTGAGVLRRPTTTTLIA